MRATLPATVPVELELPSEMIAPLREVLAGEYEAPYYGSDLTILDIGANVGAFSVWADLRWPGSTIHAFEPHPGTFQMLRRNVAQRTNVRCAQAAVYPTEARTLPLFSRHPGDGEAGLVEVSIGTWSEMPDDRIVDVPVLHPHRLPSATIVKVDVEGSEGAILESMNLDGTELILAEYQNLHNLMRLRQAAGSRFETIRHISHPWVELLRNRSYRPELRNDRYGTIVLANRRVTRLRRGEPAAMSQSLRGALRPVPSLLRQAVQRRLARARRRDAPAAGG